LVPTKFGCAVQVVRPQLCQPAFREGIAMITNLLAVASSLSFGLLVFAVLEVRYAIARRRRR
jgi:hypothetical protein